MSYASEQSSLDNDDSYIIEMEQPSSGDIDLDRLESYIKNSPQLSYILSKKGGDKKCNNQDYLQSLWAYHKRKGNIACTKALSDVSAPRSRSINVENVASVAEPLVQTIIGAAHKHDLHALKKSNKKVSKQSKQMNEQQIKINTQNRNAKYQLYGTLASIVGTVAMALVAGYFGTTCT